MRKDIASVIYNSKQPLNKTEVADRAGVNIQQVTPYLEVLQNYDLVTVEERWRQKLYSPGDNEEILEEFAGGDLSWEDAKDMTGKFDDVVDQVLGE